MMDFGVKTPQSVEITLLEELVERDYAYLRHFSLVRDKEAARLTCCDNHQSWPEIKHQKQKQIYRQCAQYSKAEINNSLAKLWKERGDKLYAGGDFDGLMQLRHHIEIQRLPKGNYAELLQQRHQELQEEISSIRESNRRLRVSSIREKQSISVRMI